MTANAITKIISIGGMVLSTAAMIANNIASNRKLEEEIDNALDRREKEQMAKEKTDNKEEES